MNFHLGGDVSLILMSLRPNSPYSDRVEDDGSVLIYEGHDVSKTKETPIPNIVDQPMKNASGTLTQNGLFYRAAQDYKNGQGEPELVKVYEKLHSGIWVYNGIFELVDAWLEESKNRTVFKFKLQLIEDGISLNKRDDSRTELSHDRIIPSQVKLAVWRRDNGRCLKCGSTDNLHFDHIIPFSKGGSSLIKENIQLLCARHNLEKRDKIE
ncbi:HNH endonuclease [Chloroflexota bacterium]